MGYEIKFSKQADKTFSKLDNSVQKLIFKWIYKNLENCENPRQQGKALQGNLAGYWRYRIGNYRVISKIEDEQLTILLIDINHRSKIYTK